MTTTTTTTTTTHQDGSTTHVVTQDRTPNWIQRFQHWPLVWKLSTAWSALWLIIWFAAMMYYNTGPRSVLADYGIGNYATYRGESEVMFVVSLLCVIGFGVAAYLTRTRRTPIAWYPPVAGTQGDQL